MSELDFETTDYAPAADDYSEPDFGGEVDITPAVDPQTVAETTDAMLAQVEQTVAEFQAATGSWKPSQQEWENVKAQLSTLPGYAEHVAGQQAQARAELVVEHYLSELPADVRGRALELAETYAREASAKFGADRTLAEASLMVAANQAASEKQAADEFVWAADKAAKSLGVANLDVGRAFQNAQAAMPKVAHNNPGMDVVGVTALAIAEAVSQQHPAGGDRLQQVSDVRGLAMQLEREIKARSLPQPPNPAGPDYQGFNYRANPTAKAANVATGRIQRRT
jgi:hypothetical protein